MKYCPYCGADLLKEDAAFCVECGKQLSVSAQATPTNDQQPVQKIPPEDPKAANVVPQKSKEKVSKKKMPKKEKRKKKAETPIPEIMGEPVDDGYDGYYNDVLPPDLDRAKEGLDKELIKKIVALGIAVVFIIGICVAMMYLL